MAKETGLGAGFFVDGVDLSSDTGSVGTISKSMAVIEMTGIDKAAKERKPGLLDGSFTWSSFFNPTNAHPELADLPRTDRVASYWHRRSILGTPVASMVAKQLNYDPNREASGALTFGVETKANAQWVDWGLSLTAGARTDVAPTNGTSVDFNDWGGGNLFGLQMYVHVLAFTGTDCTIQIEDSPNNAAWSAVPGAAVVATAAATSFRVATGRTEVVDRWLRVVTSGTFSSITFLVAATVNRTLMVI